MIKKNRKSLFRIFPQLLLLALFFSSCEVNDDLAFDVQGTYGVDGYIYPLYNPNLSYANYYNIGLDIEWAGYNRAYVYLYDRYDYFEPFYPLDCRVYYDRYEGAYCLYNGYYPDMALWVYPNGYIYLDFPYINYYGRPCGYCFSGYIWSSSPFYKPARKEKGQYKFPEPQEEKNE